MKSKRLLSALLTVVLVVTLTPVNVVFAAAGEGVYVNTITSPLDLTSGDVSGDGYSWDSAANTLTLTGLCIDLAGDTSSSAIKLPNNNTTIIVEGTNKIIGGKAAIQLASGSGTFTIKGADEENPSGNILEIKDSVVALSINNRSTPVVWEDVTFYSETEGLAAECPYGITFRNSDISVTATSEKSTYGAGAAIYSRDDITIEGSKVYAENAYSYPAIVTMGSTPNYIVRITDSEVKTKTSLWGLYNFLGAVEISNSALDFTESAAGIYAQRYIEIDGGSVEAAEGCISVRTGTEKISSGENTGDITVRGSASINGIIRSGMGEISIEDTAGINALVDQMKDNTLTVYGQHTQSKDLTIAEEQTLIVREDAVLTIPEGVELIVNGEVQNNGAILNEGTITAEGPVKNSGTLQNEGTITNNDVIDNTGTIRNRGTMDGTADINNTDGVISNNGTIVDEEQRVKGKAPVSGFESWIDAGMAAQEDTDYSADAEGNYTVMTAKGLAKIANIVNGTGGEAQDSLAGKTVTLAADIDLAQGGVLGYDRNTLTADNSWIPIGNASANSFKGTFEGAGHKISNLYVQVSDAPSGLFGCNAGTIQNTELASGQIMLNVSPGSKSEYSVGMVAINVNTVSGCVNRAEVKAVSETRTDDNIIYVGGIAGLANTSTATEGSRIIGCVNYGDVSGSGKSGTLTQIYAGGVCGYNYGGMISDRSSLIDDCANYGNVAVQDCHTARAGGIAGYVYAQSSSISAVVRNCINTGSVYGNAGYCMTGGIVGYHYKTTSSILNCYNTGTVTGNKNNGGIVGLSTGTVANCYNTGVVSGEGNQGGVAGKKNGGTIANCYALDTSASKLAGSGTLTSSSFFSSVGGVNTLETAVYETTDLLTALNAWVDAQGSEEFFTWTDGEVTAGNSYPEFGKLWKEPVLLNVDHGQTSVAYTSQAIVANPTVTLPGDDGSAVTLKKGDDYTIRYYAVNADNTAGEEITGDIINIGSYLFVIELKPDGSYGNGEYTFAGGIPSEKDISGADVSQLAEKYEACGILNVTAGAVSQQKPIYFAEGMINKYVTDGSFTNTVVNTNAGAATVYTSSNKAVAEVDSSSGAVTIVGAGTATIMATSTMNDTSPVYASYTLNVTKEPVTLTAPTISVSYGTSQTDAVAEAKKAGVTISKEGAELSDIVSGSQEPDYTVSYTAGSDVGGYELKIGGLSSEKYDITYVSGMLNVTPKILSEDDFEVSCSAKIYDGTTAAALTASVKAQSKLSTDLLTVEISGAFEDAGAADAKTVNYTITGLGGRDSGNYEIAGDEGNAAAIDGTVTGSIEKAPVTVNVASNITRVYDGTAQSADVTAWANGGEFTDFSVSYKKDGIEVQAPTEVGTYDVVVSLGENAAANYELQAYEAKLTVTPATQDVFTIEGIPERVYYGDILKLQTAGASSGSVIKYEITEGSDICSLNGDELTLTGTGQVTITATSSLNGHKDRTATRTFNVNRRIVTPLAAAKNRTYDGTNEVEVEISLSGVLNADSEEVKASASGVMATPDAGTGKIVFVNEILLSGDAADNYILSAESTQTSVDIARAKITEFSISAEDKVYDGNTAAKAEITSLTGILPEDEGQVSLVGNAVFDEANAGERTVTYTASGLTGAKSGNYTLTDTAKTADAQAKITPAQVIFSIGAASFIYDGKEHGADISAVQNGAVFRDYTVTYNGETELPKNAGDYTVSITLSDSTNYTGAPESFTLTISAADQSKLIISGLPATVDYERKFTLTASGGEGSGAISWKSSDESLAEVDENGCVTIVGVGGEVTITAVKAADGNYKEQQASITFTPVKKSAALTLSGLSHTYDGTVKAVSVSGADSENYDVVYRDSAGNEVKNPVDAGSYQVTVTAKGCYEGSVSGVMTIAKAKMTGDIALNMSDGVYGQALAGASVSGNPEGTSVMITYAGSGIYTPQADVPKNAGSYTAIAAITGDNYEALTLTKPFIVEKATLTVSVKDASRAYGASNPIFEIEYDGFVGDDTAADLLVEPAATTAATPGSAVGDYDIVVSGGRSENYSFVYKNGTLTVEKATGGNFYIDGSGRNVTVGDSFTLRAHYGSEIPQVKWSSSDPNIVEIDEATGAVTVKASGNVTITAVMTDESYGADPAVFELVASKKNISLSCDAADLVKTYNGGEQPLALKSSDSGFTVTDENVKVSYALTSDASVTVPKQAGVYTVSYEIDDAGYTGSGTFTMYINKAEIIVKAKDLRKVYGEENPAYELEIVSGGNLSAGNDEIAEAVENLVNFSSPADETGRLTKAGEYEIDVTLKSSDTGNTEGAVIDPDSIILKISDEKGVLTVEKAPLSVQIADVSRAYGGENPVPEVSFSGFVNDETQDVLQGELSFLYDESITPDTDAGEYEDVVTVDLSAGGFIGDNYEISYVYADGNGADLTVTKLPITISAGTSRTSYLTVRFSEAVKGLTADNFKVMINENGEEQEVALTGVTEGSSSRSYTLSGTFSTSDTYTVTVTLNGTDYDVNYEIDGAPLLIKPASGSSGGSGGGTVTPVSYTVTFDSRGGSEVSSLKVTSGETAVKPADPEKEGYTFEGWFTDSEGTSAYDFSAKVTKSFTLYAKWSEASTPGEDGWKNPFTDVSEGNWFYDAVKYVSENGLFSGVSDTQFAPNSAVTRGMIVTVLYRAEGEPSVTEKSGFADVASGAYYADAVAWAEKNGIVLGYSAEEYRPEQLVSREQMAAIMERYGDYQARQTDEKGDLSRFADQADISGWARANVEWAVGCGLLSGRNDGTLDPKGSTSRAELAAIMQRYLEG